MYSKIEKVKKRFSKRNKIFTFISLFFIETDRLHQSTDSLADSSSKGINQFLCKIQNIIFDL